MSSFHMIKSIIQYTAIVFSLLLNSILILLVVHKSPKKIGTYKYLMCYFCFMSMIYAILDFIVQPYIHSFGCSFSMIMDLKNSFFENSRFVAFLLTGSLAACFGITIYAIAINFIYRYFAIQREGRVRYFAGFRLIIWLSIPISVGIMWLSVAVFFLGYDKELTEYLRTSINNTYGLNANEITFTGCMYFRRDANGNENWSWEDSVGAAILCILMTIAFFIICIFGYKSHRKINRITSNGESDYSRRVQKQLYNALVLQTAIPIVFLFFPIGALFTAPLLRIEMEKGSFLVTFFYSFYPVVDPIPTIYFVDEYRNAFMNFFRRRFTQRQVASVISYDANPDLP